MTWKQFIPGKFWCRLRGLREMSWQNAEHIPHSPRCLVELEPIQEGLKMFKRHRQRILLTFAWMGQSSGLWGDSTRAKLCFSHSDSFSEISLYFRGDPKESRMAMRLQEDANISCMPLRFVWLAWDCHQTLDIEGELWWLQGSNDLDFRVSSMVNKSRRVLTCYLHWWEWWLGGFQKAEHQSTRKTRRELVPQC